MTHTEKKLKDLIESQGFKIRDWSLVDEENLSIRLSASGTYSVCSYRDAALYLDTVLADPEFSRQLEAILNPQTTREETAAA